MPSTINTDMPTSAPSRKVVASTAAAAVTTFVLWVLATYVFDNEVPEQVAGLVALLIPALVTFIAGYLTKRASSEVAPQHRRDAI